MATCIKYDLSPSYCWKKFKCRCFSCKEWKRIATHRNRKRARVRSRLWRLANPERSRQNAKRYQKQHPEQLLKWQLKKYNLTVRDYKQLLLIQQNRCAICRSKSSKKNFYFRLQVDHNHKTGKVRGLLCGNCNTALGKFQESEEFLQQAIRYLRRRK